MSKKNKTKKQKNGSRFFRAIYATLSGVVGLLFRIKTVNAQNEPDCGGYMVCANHVSATDPIVISYAFRKSQVHFMAKKELFKIPVLSGFFKMLGAFPIDRGGNDVGAIRKAVSIIKDGKAMGIFPQGHRYPGQDPRKTEIKNGAALIASRTEASVVPVYIWRKKNKMRLFRRTYVIIGEQIPFESFGFDKTESGAYARVSEAIFDRICALGEGFDPKEYKKEGSK